MSVLRKYDWQTINSLRVRLTLWYVLIFGVLLLAFSIYIYSSVAADMHQRFDFALLRTAQAMATYYSEFNRGGSVEEAGETIQSLKEGRESAALFRGKQLLAATDDGILSAFDSTDIFDESVSTRQTAFATDKNFNKRLVVMPFQSGGINYTVAVLEPLDKLDGQIRHTRNLILVGFPVALLLAIIGGFLLVRKSLAPMVVISNQAEHISAQNLGERLEVVNPNDELGQMTEVFNRLLSRLDASFRVMREFMADASHELRTPLTIIHGEAEVSLSRGGTAEEYEQSLKIICDQSKRMTRIVGDLLALARADAGERQLKMEEIYLNDLVEECCRFAVPLAQPKNISLNYDTGEDVLFFGNEELLRRMIVNLIENAVRYTSDGGTVTVKLISEKSIARLTVADTGIGIPPDCVGRVFDRFYRVDDLQKRTNGNGLGLSIVKLAAESHHGSVAVASELGRGSVFTVSLPF